MTAAFLCNRCPSCAVGPEMSPCQVWTGEKPLLANLKVFGCHAYFQVPKQKRSKFDARSVRCRYLGYSEHEKAYRFEDIENHRVMTSREARFIEDVFNHGKRSSTVVFQDEMVVDETSSQTDETDQDTDDAASNRNSMLDSTKNSQPQAPPDVDFEPGSKRHQRNRSLEQAVQIPGPRNTVFTDPRRLQILKLPTLLIQLGICLLPSSRRWNQATRPSGRMPATPEWHHCARTRLWN